MVIDKPPYRVPLMTEINALPHNGLNIVSTFSGCGGSCLGFKMSGYRVLWANEFVPAAQDTYRANHQSTHLDTSDIRIVTGAKIRAVIGDVDIDVLEGSPPCASFSMAGKRQEGWGQVRKYSDVEQRTDDLFDHYVRLISELKPRAFVAENVAGLVTGVGKGFFKRYLALMQALPYSVEARLIDAQFLGVPQARTRVIFIGVRKDVGEPAWPVPLPYRYSVRDAIDSLQNQGGARINNSDTSVESAGASLDGYAVGDEWDKLKPGESSNRFFSLVRVHGDQPCPTVTTRSTGGVATITHPSERRQFSIDELRRICGFPDDFVFTGTYSQQYERMGRAVPPPMMAAIAQALVKVLK